MAFFSKLKDRLFKSSSKLDKGLDAIVDDASDEQPDIVPEAAPEKTADATPAPAETASPSVCAPGSRSRNGIARRSGARRR